MRQEEEQFNSRADLKLESAHRGRSEPHMLGNRTRLFAKITQETASQAKTNGQRTLRAKAKHIAAGIPTWSPSFQLTVAVCA